MLEVLGGEVLSVGEDPNRTWRFHYSLELERVAAERCANDLAAQVIRNYLSQLRDSCSKAGKKASATRKAQEVEEKECRLKNA